MRVEGLEGILCKQGIGQGSLKFIKGTGEIMYYIW